jgi:hypothetical protein
MTGIVLRNKRGRIIGNLPKPRAPRRRCEAVYYSLKYGMTLRCKFAATGNWHGRNLCGQHLRSAIGHIEPTA